MHSSKLGICSGYHLPIDILKGFLFCQKWYMKRVRVGKESPRIILLSTPRHEAYYFICKSPQIVGNVRHFPQNLLKIIYFFFITITKPRIITTASEFISAKYSSFLKSTNAFSAIVVDHAREKENTSIKGDGGTAGLTENARVLRQRMMT